MLDKILLSQSVLVPQASVCILNLSYESYDKAFNWLADPLASALFKKLILVTASAFLLIEKTAFEPVQVASVVSLHVMIKSYF